MEKSMTMRRSMGKRMRMEEPPVQT